MIQVTCIHKFRDTNGKIRGYRLKDNNGNITDITSDSLKEKIKKEELSVNNLTLASDGRLISKEIKETNEQKTISNRPYDSDSYFEFSNRLIQLLEKTMRTNEDIRLVEVDRDAQGELTSCVCNLGFIRYKNKDAYISYELTLDKKNNKGYFSLSIMEYNENLFDIFDAKENNTKGTKLYSVDKYLYVNNMKADFNNILKLCEKVVFERRNNNY